MRHRLFYFAFGISMLVFGSVHGQNTAGFTEVKARVVDYLTREPLAYCNVMIDGTDVATVTNLAGDFSLKISGEHAGRTLLFSHIGYMNKKVPLAALPDLKGLVRMHPVSVQLPQIDVFTTDAETLVRSMFLKIPVNYAQQDMRMTAFYRESVRKNKRYVSLSEAVVDIWKEPYGSARQDVAKLYRSRKQTDYNRLDTLALKLMGGPYNNIYLDVMRYPEFVFTEDVFRNYHFIFNRIERIDDRLIFVVDFERSSVSDEVLYKGILYIDAATMALKSAVFSMDLDNRAGAIRKFIRKKPLNAKVTPVQADYRVDYVEYGGKWYYAFSSIQLGLKINWKRKLFHSTFYSDIEMAVTDKRIPGPEEFRFRERLKSNVIMDETADSFADPDFWGPYNVIEPDKSIESAIKKIKKQLDKE